MFNQSESLHFFVLYESCHCLCLICVKWHFVLHFLYSGDFSFAHWLLARCQHSQCAIYTACTIEGNAFTRYYRHQDKKKYSSSKFENCDEYCKNATVRSMPTHEWSLPLCAIPVFLLGCRWYSNPVRMSIWCDHN